ncbi:family 78 glycoside hydrolase catalytic domain [Mucilaginibacter terrae]|uniref:family 78 glycoside hydrolase catalytic domain n=1 Tax=Mucilaginibacter terrae TaxID=1955052 RepID=UPI0036341B99
MTAKHIIIGLVVLFFIQNSVKANGKNWAITQITVDYSVAPINVNHASPGISWILSSNKNNQYQAAYQVLIATSVGMLKQGKADVWDSGKVNLAKAQYIHPNSKLIKPNHDYYIQVTSWNRQGDKAISNTTFSTALFDNTKWEGEWIGYTLEKMLAGEKPIPSPDSLLENRSQYLRKQVNLVKNIKRARVMVSGLGFYELSINGKKVGDHVLAPAKTRYTDRALYEVFDVKESLKYGSNVLGIQLGNGWYNPLKKYQDWRMPFYGYPRAALRLYIDYTDGSTEIIKTDNSWKAAFGPITFNSVYDGEHYDARLEQTGWNMTGYNDQGWKVAKTLPAPGKLMEVNLMPAERVTQIMKPVKVFKKENGTVIYDMGQNFAGWARIKVHGSAGTVITLRHAEDLQTVDSSLNTKSNRAAANEDRYTLKGTGTEIYEPRFTSHGFQYLQVSLQGQAEILSAEGCVVHNDLPQTSELTTDHDLINRVHQATLWSQRSNMQGLPLDCPQRDERLGWMADGYVTADEAMLNFDAPLFYTKWADDARYAQDSAGRLQHISPTFVVSENTNWSCGMVLVVWDHYRNYGDARVLQTYYPAIKKYVNYLAANAKDYILKPDRYGDWGNPAQDSKATSGWLRGNPAMSTTAMFYLCTKILSDAAGVLNNAEDKKYYERLKQNTLRSFNKNYFDETIAAYKGEEYHYQYRQIMPLYLGLVPAKYKAQVMHNLVTDITEHRQGHPYIGIIGLKYMLDLFTQENRNDLIYSMLNVKGYPGFDYMLQGRNTFPEWWDGSGSHNHVMFGSIDAWFYHALAGINTDDTLTGFRKIIIKPYIPESGLNMVEAGISTVNGRITSGWKREGNRVKLQVSLPANTSGSIQLPQNVKDLRINGASIKGVITDDHILLQVGNGNFEVNFIK